MPEETNYNEIVYHYLENLPSFCGDYHANKELEVQYVNSNTKEQNSGFINVNNFINSNPGDAKENTLVPYKKIKIIDNRILSNEVDVSKEETNYTPEMIVNVSLENTLGENRLSFSKFYSKYGRIVKTLPKNEPFIESDYDDNNESLSDEYLPDSNESSFSSEDCSSDSEEVPQLTSRTKNENDNGKCILGNISTDRKPVPDKDLCPFCFEDVGHFSRHLTRKHSDEEKVKKILELRKKSKERRMAIIALRNKGNFILKTERNELKPMRKPNFSGNIEQTNYYPCTACLGYYKKTYLWRHKKVCKALTSRKNEGSRTQHLTEAQTFLAATDLLGDYLDESRLKTQVFPIMRPDQISLAAKSDPLICLYGESYLQKHKRKQINVIASNRIREMARLKLALQTFTTVANFIDFLKPEMYNNFEAASKIICGFDSETRTFKASSLALHLGKHLKFLCDVARKAITTKDPLFSKLENAEREQKLKDIADIRDMFCSHWCNDISSLANKVLNETKSEKPKLVPLTADIR